jgi:hypothetical protein
MPGPDGGRSSRPLPAQLGPPTSFFRPNGHPEISGRPFDIAAPDAVAFVDDSTASAPPSSESLPPAPKPCALPAKSLPPRRSRRRLRADLDAAVAVHEQVRRFGDACYEAISAVFPLLTGNQMNDVKEALGFCLPKWMAVINRPDPPGPPRGRYYHEYIYYSDEEDED